jgi:hypothetical protein
VSALDAEDRPSHIALKGKGPMATTYQSSAGPRQSRATAFCVRATHDGRNTHDLLVPAHDALGKAANIALTGKGPMATTYSPTGLPLQYHRRGRA